MAQDRVFMLKNLNQNLLKGFQKKESLFYLQITEVTTHLNHGREQAVLLKNLRIV